MKLGLANLNNPMVADHLKLLPSLATVTCRKIIDCMLYVITNANTYTMYKVIYFIDEIRYEIDILIF